MTNKQSSTTAQLRADIDSGRTGDKVAAGDPAAAPLGTDEEAAGTPVPAAAVAEARSNERTGETPKEQKGGAVFYMTIIATIMVILASATAYLAQRIG